MTSRWPWSRMIEWSLIKSRAVTSTSSALYNVCAREPRNTIWRSGDTKRPASGTSLSNAPARKRTGVSDGIAFIRAPVIRRLASHRISARPLSAVCTKSPSTNDATSRGPSDVRIVVPGVKQTTPPCSGATARRRAISIRRSTTHSGVLRGWISSKNMHSGLQLAPVSISVMVHVLNPSVTRNASLNKGS